MKSRQGQLRGPATASPSMEWLERRYVLSSAITSDPLLADRAANVGGLDSARSVEHQPDGKRVVLGRSQDRPVLTRLNPNGTIDRSFGENGIALLKLAGTSRDFALAPD